MTTIVKLCLKSLQEFVRLQTFNRSGFQQIQLDIQFLRFSIKDSVEDEAAVDFLLDEVRDLLMYEFGDTIFSSMLDHLFESIISL